MIPNLKPNIDRSHTYVYEAIKPMDWENIRVLSIEQSTYSTTAGHKPIARDNEINIAFQLIYNTLYSTIYPLSPIPQLAHHIHTSQYKQSPFTFVYTHH